MMFYTIEKSSRGVCGAGTCNHLFMENDVKNYTPFMKCHSNPLCTILCYKAVYSLFSDKKYYFRLAFESNTVTSVPTIDIL
mgnify:CR=1 FL=1